MSVPKKSNNDEVSKDGQTTEPGETLNPVGGRGARPTSGPNPEMADKDRDLANRLAALETGFQALMLGLEDHFQFDETKRAYAWHNDVTLAKHIKCLEDRVAALEARLAEGALSRQLIRELTRNQRT